MVVSEIKNNFNVQWDEFSSGEIPDDRLNYIFDRAQTNYWEKLMNSYQINSAVTAELQPLIVEATPSVGAGNTVDLTNIPDYKRILGVQTTYVVNGVTYTDYAKELPTEELGSYYSRGTVRYPRYRMIQDTMIVTPDSPTVVVNVVYFRKPFDIDFTDILDPNIPYIEKSIAGIIDEALSIASTIYREDGYYNVAEREQRENSNSL